MSKFNYNKKFLLSGIVSIALAIALYFSFTSNDLTKEVNRFQQQVLKADNELSEYLLTINKSIADQTTEELWEQSFFAEEPVLLHLIQENQLIYWNNDLLPLAQYLERNDSVPAGIHRFNNGYYLIKKSSDSSVEIIISCLIKTNFPYQNEHLQNKLIRPFNIEGYLDIHPAQPSDFPIYNQAGELLCYVTPHLDKSLTRTESLLIFLLCLFGLFSFLQVVTRWLTQLAQDSRFFIFVFPLVLLVMRTVLLLWVEPYFFANYELFAPDLYASSSLFPNFGSLIISLLFFSFFIVWIYRWTSNYESKQRFIPILFYLILLPFSFFISWLFNSLISNSSISLELEKVFTLDIYSLFSLLLLTLLFFCYYLIASRAITLLYAAKYKLNQILVLWGVTGVLYFLFKVYFGDGYYSSSLWPIILIGVLLFVHERNQGKINLGYSILIITVFGAYSAFNLQKYNALNEQQKRVLYANQLISDRDAMVELEYLNLSQSIHQNELLKSALANYKLLTVSQLSFIIDEHCLSNFWDRFDISYYLFDEEKNNLLDYISTQIKPFSLFQQVLLEHGEQSEFSPELYYIKDYHDRLSYLAKIKLHQSRQFTLILEFRSKKIPEQLGIPRLLINQYAQALSDLETYSIGRYSQEGLLMHYGEFNYPTQLSVFITSTGEQSGFFNYRGFNHFIHHQDEEQYIVISKPEPSFFESLTNFSYLFLFFGISSLIIALATRKLRWVRFIQLPLSLKIQVVFILTVIAAFAVFSWVASEFVRNQYHTYNNDNLKERLHSVEIEVRQKLGDKEELDAEVLGKYMEYILKKFSTVFMTDINLYHQNGQLLASSQPTLYNKGIIGSQMNPQAYAALTVQKKSEFTHQENIGSLNYLSAYLPFTNNQGQLLGYLNLQHFAKQHIYENQVSGFLIAIINITVLLLVITLVIAIFISNWITTPLRMIQESLKSVVLGGQNKPIDYFGNDEIGALVKDYNDKLTELELKAMQLAQSERESAWREMAKQVAHEIKNPLTPMKLSLQHFQRSFDPSAPNAQEKLNRLSSSLIEQINGLTNIANEFSNFAKLPKPNEEKIDLVELIKNNVQVFKNDDNVVRFTTSLTEAYVYADRDLMIRVLNNILKNALQAIPEDRIPHIEVRLNKERDGYQLAIQDNGVGIPLEERKKIFVPNFTTKSTGAGLGLAMVQQIITNHQGEIWFESIVGEGTTFYVFIPANFKED